MEQLEIREQLAPLVRLVFRGLKERKVILVLQALRVLLAYRELLGLQGLKGQLDPMGPREPLGQLGLRETRV
jgi:hypothetical protein